MQCLGRYQLNLLNLVSHQSELWQAYLLHSFKNISSVRTLLRLRESMEAPLFGIADQGGYSGGFPAFHSIEEFPQLKIIETRWDIIRDELIASNGFRELNAPHSTELGGWKGMYLNNFGWLNRTNIKASPKLVSTLGEIPDVVFVALSILEPGAKLDSHWGDSNTTVRCAVGLKVPGKVPNCYLEVDGEKRSWKEGRLLLFSECYLHSAVNLTDERRVVLTIDIVRPEYSKIKSVICANVLAWQTIAMIRSLFKHPIFSSRLLTKFMLIPLILCWRIQGIFQRTIMGGRTKVS